jgi:uncharacterized protein
MKGIMDIMALKETLESDLLIATKNKDSVRKQTIRMILSNIKLLQIEKGQPVDDTDILNILQKELKLREEAIEDAHKANRPDLVHSNQLEMEVIRDYLPEQMDVEEIKFVAQQVIIEVDAHNVNDMGKIMKAILPRIQGRAPNATVSQVVRDLLVQM